MDKDIKKELLRRCDIDCNQYSESEFETMMQILEILWKDLTTRELYILEHRIAGETWKAIGQSMPWRPVSATRAKSIADTVMRKLRHKLRKHYILSLNLPE